MQGHPLSLIYPVFVQVNLWGLDAIKTKGESVAIVLHLVGARPVREGTGRIARFELVPLEVSLKGGRIANCPICCVCCLRRHADTPKCQPSPFYGVFCAHKHTGIVPAQLVYAAPASFRI